MKRLKPISLVAAVALMALAALAGGCGEGDHSSKGDAQATAPPTQASTTGSRRRQRPRRQPRRSHSHRTAPACPPAGRVLTGVYHPERLEVLNGCKRLGGTVLLVRGEEDGDLHFDVELDRRYRRVLLPGNFGQQHGALVVEFMARDGGHLPAPAAGNRVDMVGALVNDTQHHWAELHPVWAVRINGGRWSRSGPRFGGSPAQDSSYNAAADCSTPRGAACRGYGSSSEGAHQPVRPTHHGPRLGGGSGGGCEPGYSPCLPATGDLNCSDIAADKKPVRVTGSDPYGLDRDGDGTGCSG